MSAANYSLHIKTPRESVAVSLLPDAGGALLELNDLLSVHFVRVLLNPAQCRELGNRLFAAARGAEGGR